jgi:Kelch motif
MLNVFRILFAGMILLLSGCATRVWIPDWQETSSINVPRAGTAAVQIKDKIYLIGGVDGKDFLNTTEYAQIQKDGTLGPWQFGPKLNEARGFTDAIAHGDFVYVAGGGNGPNGHHLLNSVERAHIQADGTLGPWKKENGMVVARRCSKLIATDKAIYAFGGFGGVLLDSVEYAEILPDGSLGKWKLDPNVMTVPRYINSVKKEGDRFFVVGGHDQSKGIGITNVEWSRPTADGSLQKWQATTPLQQGRYALSTASYGDFLYALGGISGAEYLDSIERTTVGKDGQLQPWQPISHLDQSRAYFSTIDYNDRLYVIAGTNREGYLSSVIYANRNGTGDIGYWGTKQEAEAAKVRMAERKARKSQLPYEGLVKEVLQTQSYTYVRVESAKDGLVWLAGPKITDLKAGDRLGYSEGVSMPDFFSRELQRSFPMVIFVGEVRKK